MKMPFKNAPSRQASAKPQQKYRIFKGGTSRSVTLQAVGNRLVTCALDFTYSPVDLTDDPESVIEITKVLKCAMDLFRPEVSISLAPVTEKDLIELQRKNPKDSKKWDPYVKFLRDNLRAEKVSILSAGDSPIKIEIVNAPKVGSAPVQLSVQRDKNGNMTGATRTPA